MGTLSLADLTAASTGLGEVVVDPTAWPRVMEEICRATGTTGAILLKSDVRTPDTPWTPSVNELCEDYFSEGWHASDIRGRGVQKLLQGEPVFTDQDLFTPEDLRRAPHYQEFIVPHGFLWFAAIGFRAGSALWAMALQRTPQEGPFEAEDKAVLAQISRRLSEAATLSKAVSQSVLASCANTLNLVRQPALVVDRFGVVIDTNAAAEATFDSEVRVRNRRLCIIDPRARAEFERFVDALRSGSETDPLPTNPIVVHRRDRAPVLIRILPVEPAACSPFLGARALLMLVDLEARPRSDGRPLSKAFGLTAAEARFAGMLATGESLTDIADRLQISRETARNHLKSIFLKTGTHKQGALVALLARFGNHF